MNISKLKELKNSTLLKNTVMLYILQFSSYFLSLAVVPYQTRVLGPVVFGRIGFACGVITYFQLFMDFGFLLSATEDISKNRDNPAYINKKLTSITILKVFLGIISFAVLLGICFTVPKFREDPWLYVLYLISAISNAFIPDYLYRGIEKMTAITVRTVCIKVFFTVMVFVFVKDAGDYLIIPGLLCIGNTVAAIAAYLHVIKKLGYSFAKVTKEDIKADFRRSLFFFFSRIASTVYSTTNTIILGFIDKEGIVTGYYTASEKVRTTAANCLSPISDSLYPYMVKNRDFKLVKKLLLLFMPVILTGCVVVGIFAKPICVLVFGEDYAGTAPVLIAMLPAIAAILPNYIFGFPVLGAMGLSNYANYSIFVGTGVHIAGLTVLALTGNMNYITLAGMMSVSEICILITRITCVVKNKDKLKEAEQ